MDEDEEDDELQELQDELDEKQRQLELAAQMGQQLLDQNASLEEEVEDLKELLEQKDADVIAAQDQLQHSADLIQRFEERNAELNEELRNATGTTEDLEHRIAELNRTTGFLSDENTRLKDDAKKAEAITSDREEEWGNMRQKLEQQINQLSASARSESGGGSGSDGDDGQENAKVEAFGGGKSGRRRAGISGDLSALMNQTAVQRLQHEVETLQGQLLASETAREAEAQARREATAERQRLDVVARNAQRDAAGADRREAAAMEEVQRLTKSLESERHQIGTQQSMITGLEAEIVKLNQLSTFSSNSAVAEGDSGNMAGMVSLLDELQAVDDDTMAQERELLEKQIASANGRADAAERAKATLQRELAQLEQSGSSADRQVRQHGGLLRRRGYDLPASVSSFVTHRHSITDAMWSGSGQLRAELEALQGQAGVDKERISALDVETQRLQAALTDHSARADGLQDALAIGSAAQMERAAHLEQVEAERNGAVRQMRELRTEFEAARTTIMEKDAVALGLRREAREAEARRRELEEQLRLQVCIS
jgi:chromosome segregation ATPase